MQGVDGDKDEELLSVVEKEEDQWQTLTKEEGEGGGGCCQEGVTLMTGIVDLSEQVDGVTGDGVRRRMGRERCAAAAAVFGNTVLGHDEDVADTVCVPHHQYPLMLADAAAVADEAVAAAACTRTAASLWLCLLAPAELPLCSTRKLSQSVRNLSSTVA